jgi:segregation and condensation protein A
VRLADLELDLDVFAGPFDLLLTLILREEVDLLEVDLAGIVISYIDHLEPQPDDGRAAQSSEAGCRARGERPELDLEATTEFLVLIAALLELKSRLMLPGEELEELELDPREAAEELLARLLDAHRYRGAAAALRERLEGEEAYRFRSAPLPPQLRRAALADAQAAYEPTALTGAIAALLQPPEPVDTRHMVAPRVTVAERLGRLRALLRRGSFDFEEALERADRVTVAVTVYALLELYKQGELTWRQEEPFGRITIERVAPRADRLAAPPAARLAELPA